MIETLKEVAGESKQIRTGLIEAVQELICEPWTVIEEASRAALLPTKLAVDFVIPSRSDARGLRTWFGWGYPSILCVSNWNHICYHDGTRGHGGQLVKKGLVLDTCCFGSLYSSKLYSSVELVDLAQLHSGLFYPELLIALVDATNQLAAKVIDAIQEKNERDEDLRCRVKGTQKVNQDLLDALDRSRLLAG